MYATVRVIRLRKAEDVFSTNRVFLLTVRGIGESGGLPATEAEGVSLRTGGVDGLPLADHGVTGDHTEAL